MSLHANSKPNTGLKTSSFEIVNENTKTKTINRSAVERLEETKANYVKTESVLDCKQSFEHSSNLHVSTKPQIDVLLKGHLKSIYNCQSIINYVRCVNQQDSKHTSSLANHFVQRARSVYETYGSGNTSFSSPDNCILPRTNQTEREYTEYIDAPTSGNNQVQSRTASAGKRSLPQILKCNSPCVNENIQPSHAQVIFQPSNARHNFAHTDPDGYFSHSDATEERFDHSDEHNSLDGSEDSYCVDDDTMDLEEKKHGSRTSDYVSRSSSFKCSLSSDRVKNLVKSFESRMNKNSSPTARNVAPETEKRKSVSRSKSDVSCRVSKNISIASETSNGVDSELERFFNSMGLDSSMWQSLTATPNSPVRFFDSISSINSDDHLSSAGSEDSTFEVQKEGLTNSDLRRHAPTETSIVEKNARVVKWLYNCHNAWKKSS